MLKKKFYVLISFLIVLVLSAIACTPTPDTTVTQPPEQTSTTEPTTTTTPPATSEVTGLIQLFVTDAPPREEVTSIMVTVTEVQVHIAEAEQEMEQEQEENTGDNQTPEQEQEQAQEGEGEWITIALSDNTTFDLLQVRGIEQYLGASEVTSGKYTQVRLVVSEAQVSLGGGALQDAKVPSNELKIAHPFRVLAGETTSLVLDFDADKMVTVTGSGDIIVKPVVKITTKQGNSNGPDNVTEPELKLEDTEWVLQSYGATDNLTAVLEGTEITAEFVSSEGAIKGSSGCNSYSGSYEVNGSKLSIPGPIAVTEMYCMEPEGVMDQEQEYLTLLQLAENYEIDGNELKIQCGDQVLIFKTD